MTTVRILPEILSNKIAAGEVVERPASVVKELVENAVDAGSTSIHVEVEKGGRSLIRVSDNGAGMAHDDALLAMERYATSKIHADEDLFAIHTLGFRGEALPSIASVSRFELVSKDEGSAAATRIRIAGGRILDVAQMGAPRGTMITVENLFFNTPARRKFLKTVNTEMGHITDTLSNMAMGNPHIRFKLTHNGKTLYNWSETRDPSLRVADVLGKELHKGLFPIAAENGDLSVTGWAAADRFARSTNRGLFVYVNHRFVRDKVITHAVFEGYSGRLMKGKYPTAIIFITIAPEKVDVNVHPTKHEVRFTEAAIVHDLVRSAVAHALQAGTTPLWQPPPLRPAEGAPGAPFSNRFYSQRPAPPQAATPPERPKQATVADRPSEPGPAPKPPVPRAVPSNAPARPAAASAPPAELFRTREQESLWQKRFFSDLRVVGQLLNTYVVCESEDGMILIDQHAAHERIMYEQLKKEPDREVPRQRLLIPEVLELGFREADILSRMMPKLADAGWEIEPFGPDTFAVKAVPSVLSDTEVAPVIQEMIDTVAEVGVAADPDAALEQSRKIMACHGAIRASQSLSEKHLNRLLNQLDGCRMPDNCPHGRPTWIRLSKTDLEKQFKRIV